MRTTTQKIFYSTLTIPAGNKNTVFAGITFASNTRGEIVKITDNSTGFSNASFKSVLQTQSPVNKIAAHPTSADILFAGTGAFYGFQNPGGLFISRDGGNSWTATSLQNVVVNSIAISPENPDIMYAGCGSSGADYAGIYKSSDGGVSWEEKTSGFPDFFAVSDIQVDDTDSNLAYAAVYKGFNTDGRWLGGIYITVDGGDYWSQIGLSDYYLLAVNTYPLESTKKLLFTSAYTDSSVLSIPSSVILAGTGSGLYSTTTAGTGFISGLVIDNATGDAISDVVVSAPGANARSVAGYYRLMLPAGAHTLQATCPGYVQVPGSAVTVSASQNVEYDIVMQAVKPDNCTCIVCEVLPEASLRNDLNLLRNYRDRILKETPAGRYFIRHYYSLGSEIKPLLQRNPALKKRVEQLLFRAVPAVKASLTNNKFIIPESILNEGDLLLRDLEQIAPSGLREKIKRARNSLKELGLTI